MTTRKPAPPTGSPAPISAAQLPAERTGAPAEYARYEARPAGTPTGNLDPPIQAPDSRSKTLAVVSAGIGVPSSTRLLADRLAAATTAALAEQGVEAGVEVWSCASTPTSSWTPCSPASSRRACARSWTRSWAPTA